MLTYFIDQKLRQGSVETACLCSTVPGASANMMIQMAGPDFYSAEHCSHLEGASYVRHLGWAPAGDRLEHLHMAYACGLSCFQHGNGFWEKTSQEQVCPGRSHMAFYDLTLEVTQWFAEVVTSPPRCRSRGHGLPPLNERKPKECAAI